jgi:SH3-like domain-containing protein
VQINEEVLPQEPLTSLVGVINGGNMRSEAQEVSQNVIGQVCPGDKVEIMEESDVWLKVLVQETTANCVEERVSSGTMGWIHSSLVLPPSSPLASPTLTPSPLASPTLTPSPLVAPGLVAKVFNGGNVRAVPGGEPILDQINANEEVTLLQKRENGLWYRIRNQRNIEGWVHSSLLRIDPKSVTKVPIAR